MKAILATTCLALAAPVGAHAADADAPSAADLARMSERFAPVPITVDLGALPASERAALAKLVAAARVLDDIFLAQMGPANGARLVTLAEDRSALGAARLDYFLINKGPWSRLDANAPFLPGAGARPDQAGFYPADATKAEVEAWIKGLPAAGQAAATGFFTTIRRAPGGGFVAVPYSQEYQNDLIVAARYLREAAALTRQPTLRAFLESRAAAFLSNDYFASDMAWMEMDSSLEPTIGPYEVYEDDWFNYKAAFEAFITVTDAAESAKLNRFDAELQGLEDKLPIEKRWRTTLGGHAPLKVVNVVFGAGDGNVGVQTAAYNLPNDERVVAAKGSKRILLHNYQEAKYNKMLAPIAERVLAPADFKAVSFEHFFTHTLMHELMHGLGPQTITVDGRATTVRQELKELNGLFEEAKADVSGLWALQQLIDKGVLPKAEERGFYVTFVASTLRTLRFGATEAHARGMALQLNYYLDAGAVTLTPDGRMAIDLPKAKKAVAALTHEIMTLQATGNYAKAKEWLGRMQVIRPEIKRLIGTLTDLPVDIRPEFVTAATLPPG